MAYNATQADIDLLYQTNKAVDVKVQLLNQNYKIIDEIQGKTISGSLNMDSTSDMRRSCNISLLINKGYDYIVGNTKESWLDKYIRIVRGVSNQRTKEMYWYNSGIFLVTDITKGLSATSHTLELSCSDLMYKLTGEYGGELSAETITIPVDSVIRDVIISLITPMGFINYLVADVGQTTPYELTFSNSTARYEVIKTLRDLYMTYETFFDENGVFIFQHVPNCLEDDVYLDLDVFDKLIIDESENTSLANVRNKVTVWGKDGIRATWEDENPDSPYIASKIGVREISLSGSDYEKIPTVELCAERAEYEGWKRTRLEDSITLNMIDIPWLDLNKKVTYKSNQYITKSIDRDFVSGTMSITMTRFYPLYPYSI